MAKAPAPPIVVIYGDDEHQKAIALDAALDALLPPPIDRALSLSTYDGSRSADQGGPSLVSVLEDLATLPFFSGRRVVLIREADAFITAHRERLEKYATAPARTGALLLECRAFPKTTRLHKATLAAGGQVRECKKLTGRALVEFVVTEARRQEKRIDPAAAARLIDLVGSDSGILAGEIVKLCLYVGSRATVTDQDVTDLVGQSREERIFAVMDAAGLGRLSDALRLWRQVLATDPAAAYRALGGMAFVVRRWLAAHRMVAAGEPIPAIAPRMMMWGRDRELETILRRLSPQFLRGTLAAMADLDSQAKVGARSIETGVELLLTRLAAPAA